MPVENLYENGILITGVPDRATREAFYEEAAISTVHYLNDEEFKKQAWPDDWHLAMFHRSHLKKPGNSLVKATISVNVDEFHLDGEDYTDLIPIVVRHEVAKIYFYAKNGYSLYNPRGRDGGAHCLALREEWRYAVELGKVERYWEFTSKFAEILKPYDARRFLAENWSAYQLALRRHH